MGNTLLKKIALANNEISRTIKFLKDNEEAFNYMNLKLYDASYYSYDKLKEDFPLLAETNNDYFSDFCNNEYEMFFDYFIENYNINIDKMIYHIGRTSTFYLHDKNLIELSRNNKIDFDVTIENTIMNFYCDYLYIEIKDGKININTSDDIEDITDTLNYIINDLYNDIINYCNDIILVYNAIKTFKDNQVANFKEYLGFENDILLEQIEEDNKEKQENYNKCLNIKNKYNISAEDMEILKKFIKDYN